MSRWHMWWLFLFLLVMGSETVALLNKRSQDTLSETIWWLLGVKPHQPIDLWNWRHVLGAFILLGLFVWLFGHFIFDIWKG